MSNLKQNKQPSQTTVARQLRELERFRDSEFPGKNLLDVARLIQDQDRKLLKRLYPKFSKGIGVYGLVESGAREYVRQKYPSESIVKRKISKTIVVKEKLKKVKGKFGKYKKSGKFTSTKHNKMGLKRTQFFYPDNLWNTRKNDFSNKKYASMESTLFRISQVWDTKRATSFSFQYVYFVVKYVDITLELIGEKWKKTNSSIKRYGIIKVSSEKGTQRNSKKLIDLALNAKQKVREFRDKKHDSVRRKIYNVKCYALKVE